MIVHFYPLYCTAVFVPFAGVSHGSIFFSQFSIVGLGISPGSKSPFAVVRSVQHPLSTRMATQIRSSCHRGVKVLLAASRTGFEEGHTRHIGRLDPDSTSTFIAPSSLHLRSTVGFHRVSSWFWARSLDIIRLDKKVRRMPSRMGLSWSSSPHTLYKISLVTTYMAPAHLRQSMQSTPRLERRLMIGMNPLTYGISSSRSALGLCTCGGHSCNCQLSTVP